MTSADPTHPRLDALMARYAAGEDDTFEELYELLSKRLFSFCVRLCRQQGEAEDLYQDVWVRMHRARATFVLRASVDGRSTAIPWVFAVARSAFLDGARARRRRPQLDSETDPDHSAYATQMDPNGSPEDHARGRQVIAVVERALTQLPESQRLAYVLLREEGLSVSEAAAILGGTTTAVKLRAHRAYEAIREALRGAGFEEPS